MKKIQLILIFLFFSSSGYSQAQSQVGVHVTCVVAGVALIDQVCGNPDWLSDIDGTYIPGETIATSVVGGSFTTDSNSYLAESRVRANYGELGVHSNVQLWNAVDNNSMHSQAIATASAVWLDFVTVRSDTLEKGTTVTVQVTDVVDIGLVKSSMTGGVAWNQTGVAVSDISFQSTYQTSYCIRTSDDCGVLPLLTIGRNVIQYTVDLFVGQQLYMSGELASTATIILPGADYPGFGFGIGSAIATATAFNSAHSYFTILNSDATLNFASGHDYSLAPVPEPSSIALFTFGILVLLAVVWRNRKKYSKQ